MMNFDILSNRLAGMADEVRIAIEALAELEQKDKTLNEFKKKVVLERELLHKKEAELLKKQSTVEVMIGGIEEKRKIADIKIKKADDRGIEIEEKEKVIDEKMSKLLDLEEIDKDLKKREEELDLKSKDLETSLALLKKEKVVVNEMKIILERKEKNLEEKEARVNRYLN